MFTGIVEEIGRVMAARRRGVRVELVIRALKIRRGLKRGGSVSVNGACLTVTKLSPRGFQVEMVPETLRVTALKALSPGSLVNVERAMKAGGRLDGHVVLGHVDGVGRVVRAPSEGSEVLMTVTVPRSLMKYVAKKGSLTIEGVSLTVARRGAGCTTVALIPHTLKHTTLGRIRRGTFVNLEVDVMARYLESLRFSSGRTVSKVEALRFGHSGHKLNKVEALRLGPTGTPKLMKIFVGRSGHKLNKVEVLKRHKG